MVPKHSLGRKRLTPIYGVVKRKHFYNRPTNSLSTVRVSLRDTDLNKSSDFLLNPVCIMLMYIITILLCKYLCIVQMK